MNPLRTASFSPALRRGAAAAPREAGEPVPQDRVTLGATSAPAASAPKGLAEMGQAAAGGSGAALVGGLVGAVTATLLRPVRAVVSTMGVALGFLGDMRTRAEEITRDPARVEAHLAARGMRQDYTEPVHRTHLDLEGVMTIRADMSEFFQLWDSWISQGYGSINDRQYADLARKYRDRAPDAPLLRYLPMVSEDVFSLEVRGGRVTFMDETTTSRLAGLIPTTRVEWAWERQGTPRSANSFEQTLDRFGGDLEKVEAFYNDLFDPRKVIPGSKATVDFRLRAVHRPGKRTPSGREFTHAVKVPLGGLLPRPRTTM